MMPPVGVIGMQPGMNLNRPAMPMMPMGLPMFRPT